MGELPEPDAMYEAVCPHCSRPFRAELIVGELERHRGFKCPHCKLFVPYERAEEQGLFQPAE